MANIGSCLPWLMTQHHELRIDETKAVNDNLALYALDGINDHGNRSLIQGFK